MGGKGDDGYALYCVLQRAQREKVADAHERIIYEQLTRLESERGRTGRGGSRGDNEQIMSRQS